MDLKSKMIIALAILFVLASITAGVGFNKAISAQAEIDRRDNEERIDAPYRAKLAESEAKRKKLEESLARKDAEAIKVLADIEARFAVVRRINAEHKEMIENKPDINKIEERYKNEDAETICTEFAAIDIPCERTGG